MEYRNLGSSGLVVSTLGLGCNNIGASLDASDTRDVVSAATDAGITFFDTADVYNEGRSEEFLGAALRGRRDKAVIATKCGGEAGPRLRARRRVTRFTSVLAARR